MFIYSPYARLLIAIVLRLFQNEYINIQPPIKLLAPALALVSAYFNRRNLKLQHFQCQALLLTSS